MKIETLDQVEETQGTENIGIPFPSYNKLPCPNETVRELASELVNNARDTNNILESAGNVHKFVRNHYVNVATGTYGIESLIVAILNEAGAVFPCNIGQTELRSLAINTSLFSSDIIAMVQETFGTERYPASTIRSYLSNWMEGTITKIKLTNAEDSNRTCPKPRHKYFVVG